MDMLLYLFDVACVVVGFGEGVCKTCSVSYARSPSSMTWIHEKAGLMAEPRAQWLGSANARMQVRERIGFSHSTQRSEQRAVGRNEGGEKQDEQDLP